MNLHRWVVVGMVLGLICAGPASPRAHAEDASNQTDIEVSEHYAAEAFEAYARKEYAPAVALYLKAWDAAPSADILYNVARIYDAKLKDRQLAIDYYRRYVRDPGADPTRLRAANERFSQLLELEAIDTESRIRPPPDSSARASHSDDRVRGGSNPPDHGITTLQVLGIVGLTTGVAGLGVGAGFGLAAKSAAKVASGLCDGNACRTQRGVDSSHEASNAAMISTVAFAAGGVLTALGLVALLVPSSRDERERDVASLSVAPIAGPSLVGTRITGHW